MYGEFLSQTEEYHIFGNSHKVYNVFEFWSLYPFKESTVFNYNILLRSATVGEPDVLTTRHLSAGNTIIHLCV